jgi:inorganic pyrophosphatase
MTIEKLLQQSEKFEIEVYRKPPHQTADHIPFVGSPRRHPYDDKKIILIVDPFSSNIYYYEFFLSDVQGMEELPSLVTNEGESLAMVRLWLRKSSVAVRSFPFLV